MRLFVTGPTGSGKTTLATGIARAVKIPLFCLDDMHWERGDEGDRRRDPTQRAAMLADVVQNEAWVVEGVQFKWADAALDRADTIVVLDLPRWRNGLRIMRRFAHRRLHDRSNPRGSIAALRQEFRWSNDYYDHEREMLFAKLQAWGEKVLVANTSAAALSMMARRWEREPAFET